MKKYFEIVPESTLYKEYFAYLKDKEKIQAAFRTLCAEFGIETTQFFMKKDRFLILPTENDCAKFRTVLKKTRPGEFKRDSAVSKRWIELVKDIGRFKKPALMDYVRIPWRRWQESLFHIEEKLYCSAKSDEEIPTPDFAVEMKGSEFHRIIEEYEEGSRETKEGKE